MSRSSWKVFLAVVVMAALSATATSAFAKSLVKDVRMSATGETTRVVFDLSHAAAEQVFTLHSPERVVIDLIDARLDLSNDGWPSALGAVKEFRSAERGNGVLRIVLEVAHPVESRSFSMVPGDGMGHRLVIDIASPGKLGPQSIPAAVPNAAQVTTSSIATPNFTNNIGGSIQNTAPQVVLPPPVKSLPKDEGRTLVIAIDAGHGGQDPGASGRRGTREKDVTLAIARKLKESIDNEPGMRAVMTRDGDYFVPLRERIVRATKLHADIFVSIHADSVRDRDVAGSSVYVLSVGRATNEASRMLADRENAADLMGGIGLENKDDMIASVLLDLSQSASMSASIDAADKVLSQLDRVGVVLDNEVKHASLKVLTSPNMPSMLVETAFISNPKEEARLNDGRHQQRLADAILSGVRSYFYDNPPPGSRIAQRVAQMRAGNQERGGTGVGNIAAAGISQ